MDFFFTMLGLAIVLWAVSYNGGPIIKITRKCKHEYDHPSNVGWSPPRTGGYVPRRSGGYHSASVDRSQMRPPPQGGGGVVRPQNISKPSTANVQPPKGGSGQSKINLKKEEE